MLSLLAHSVSAQRSISGVVVGQEDQERLPFANIVVDGTTQGASTNVDGYFSLFDVTEQALTLEVLYIGYNPIKIPVAAGSEDIENLKIELQSGLSLQEVIVSAKSYKVMNASEAVSALQISPAQLSLLPNVGEVDIFRSLQLLPGVSGSNESSSGLFVRGGTPDQNLVLLDGMTVYNVDHFFGFFSAFNADAVKDAQLFKGAFPAKYGGRLSSVVDLTGKTGNPTKLQGNIGLNLLTSRLGLQIPLFKRASLSLNARRSYTDIIRSPVYNNIFNVFTQTENPPDIDGLAVNTIEPDFHFYDLNAKLSFTPSDKDVVAFSLYRGADHLVELNEATIERETPALLAKVDVDEKNDWGNRGYSGKWARQWNANWYSNMLIAGSRYFSKYDRKVDILANLVEQDSVLVDRTDLSFEDNDVQDLSFRLDNEYLINGRHKIGFGGLVTQAIIDYEFTRDDTLTILDVEQEGLYIAAYASDTWTPLTGLTIDAGIRTSYYDISDKWYWAPRFSFQYALSGDIKIKGGYGKHYQFVNRVVNENVTEGSRDFWLLADDELVKVSTAQHFILGAAYESEGYVFDVEAYRKNFDNLAEFSLRFQRNDVDLNQLFFSGSGYAQGIEFLLQKKTGAYTAWISYTLSQIRHTFPELNDGFEFSALHDQRHEFKSVHSIEDGDWRYAATFVFATGKPFTEPAGQYSIDLLDGSSFNYISVGARNASRLPAYHRLDLSVHYLKTVGLFDLDVGLSIFNFYGAENVWYREYDFSQTPPIISEVSFLGFTPNLSIDLSF